VVVVKHDLKCRRVLVLILWLVVAVISVSAAPITEGLKMHLQADHLAGLRDGDPVSLWPDRSGQERDAFQETSARRPVYRAQALNAWPAVHFDGQDDGLYFPEVTGIRTVFWVLREDIQATENWRCLLGHSNTYGFHRGPGRTIWSSQWADAAVQGGTTSINGNIVNGTTTRVPTSYAILCLRTTGPASANQLTQDRNFLDRSWAGDIVELLIYDQLLNEDETNLVGWSLQEKYQIRGAYRPVTTAYNPTPYNGQTNVDPRVSLHWDAALEPGNAGYRLYLGQEAELSGIEPVYLADQNTYSPRLAHDTQYYWRVDVDGGDPGQVWQFSTAAPVQDCPSSDFNGDCRVDFLDLAILSDRWLNHDPGKGGLEHVHLDLGALADQWLEQVGPLVISEFMARNQDTLLDQDGESSDWIEIHNLTNSAVSLDNWALTDTPEDLHRWQFPDGLRVEAGAYYIVFASGKDRRSVPGELHSNFKLDGGGEYLALVGPEGNVATEFGSDSDVFPAQFRDRSYGLQRSEKQYFRAATPGATNGDGFVGFVAAPLISHERGFYDEPFDVALTCASEGAQIYYTMDGSSPLYADGNVTATAQTYDPLVDDLTIYSTTVLRGAAFKPGWQPSPVTTHSFLFLADVIRQPVLPPGFPSTWINKPGRVSPVPAESDYEMDPYVVNAPDHRDRYGRAFDMRDALLALPTLSLVMEVKALFDLDTGIYANATYKGFDWERPASMEYIDPQLGVNVQANCGVRMHGGWNRYSEMLKKAFRLYFRERYGAVRLAFPLFDDSTLESYDQLVLRSGNGQAWASPWRSDGRLRATQYQRDQFARDCMRDMGQPTVHGCFVHLYINGLYWGLYNVTERPTADFLASYQNADEADYDVVKWNRSESPNPSVTDGNLQAWDAMTALVNQTLADGVTPYVSRAQGYDEVLAYLNVESLIDYMIMNIYINNGDWPDNNAYAIGHRHSGDGFRFFSWDAEESLNSLYGNRVDVANRNTSAWLYTRLRSNPEFRRQFGDRVHRHFFHDGALTAARVDARWMHWAEPLDRAIVAESARWGDLFREPPYGRSEWITEQERLRFSFFSVSQGKNRTQVVLEQFKEADLYPQLSAPEFHVDGVSQHGGPIRQGARIAMVAPADTTPSRPRFPPVILYTLDASDPRLTGGGLNPNAILYNGPVVLEQSTEIRTRTHLNGLWSALNEAVFSVAPKGQ